MSTQTISFTGLLVRHGSVPLSPAVRFFQSASKRNDFGNKIGDHKVRTSTTARPQ